MAIRFALVHPGGQMPLTGLGVAMVLESLTGLGGQAPTRPRLYFPCQLLDAGTYFGRLRDIGGSIVDLEPKGKCTKAVSMVTTPLIPLVMQLDGPSRIPPASSSRAAIHPVC